MTALAISNATIVTVDDTNRVVRNGTIITTDDTITYVGPDAAAPHAPGATRLDARGAIVMPGMINAHTHLAMTLFRGLADDMDLDGFLGKLLPIESAALSPDVVRTGTRLAAAESLRAGVTTALDMYFFPEAASEVAAESGMRILNGPVFIEFPGPDNREFPARLAWARAVMQRGGSWLQPHSTYLADEEQLTAIGRLAAEFNASVNVHSSETRAEITQVHARHGRTPTRVLADTGLLGPRAVCAHGVHLTDDDISLMALTGASVAHCPASNLKLASGVARIVDLQHAGVNVALGTDGAASANDLDLFMAMRLAAYLQKATTGDAAVLPAAEIVRMATINGARALGIDHLVGSLEVGKRADFVMLDPYAPALTPAPDPLSVIAYSASRAEVSLVVANGRTVVRDGKVTTLDTRAVVAEAALLARGFV